MLLVDNSVYIIDTDITDIITDMSTISLADTVPINREKTALLYSRSQFIPIILSELPVISNGSTGITSSLSSSGEHTRADQCLSALTY